MKMWKMTATQVIIRLLPSQLVTTAIQGASIAILESLCGVPFQAVMLAIRYSIIQALKRVESGLQTGLVKPDIIQVF